MIYDPADVRISVSKKRLIGGGDTDLLDPPSGSTTALERRETWSAQSLDSSPRGEGILVSVAYYSFWDSLPDDIRRKSSPLSFKTALKTCFVNSYSDIDTFEVLLSKILLFLCFGVG